MVQVVEATQGKTRDLPIQQDLRTILLTAAAAAGVDTVRVTSGGQCRKGVCAKRTGSTRHDDGQAADLELHVGGKALSFTDQHDVEVFKRFVTEAARAGATGIGGGIGYMGERTIHVGFGPQGVWGAGGRSANAPSWLVAAAKAGWPELGIAESDGSEDLNSADDESEDDYD